LRWLGHVERILEAKDVKKKYLWKLIASRPVGCPKSKWMDNVMKDIQAKKIANWESHAQGRNKLKSIVKDAETHIELQRLVGENDKHLIIRARFGMLARGDPDINKFGCTKLKRNYI
jgi:hypothetical protein